MHWLVALTTLALGRHLVTQVWFPDIMSVFGTGLKASAHSHICWDSTTFVPTILIGSYAAE